MGMTTEFAVCITCGAIKRVPLTKCEHCTFNPMLDEDRLVKSIYLSTGRFESQDKKEEYVRVLLDYASILERGGKVDFDDTELTRLKGQQEAIESAWPGAVIAALVRFFLPAVVFLCLLLLVYVVLLAMSH